jgi:hypothetical protein
LNQKEPSGVRCQYAERFETFTPGEPPALPWFDPFRNATHVPNGFCEDFLRTPVQGGERPSESASRVRGGSGCGCGPVSPQSSQ